jgi:hypothetical protein
MARASGVDAQTTSYVVSQTAKFELVALGYFFPASWRPVLAHGVDSETGTADGSDPLQSPHLTCSKIPSRILRLEPQCLSTCDSVTIHISVCQGLGPMTVP